MLTRNFKLQLILAASAVSMCSSATAADTKAQPQVKATIKQTKSDANDIPYTLHPEIDKTDSYAVPSDSTEDELNDEMEEMDELQRNPKKPAGK